MKKFVLVLLAAMVALGLGACGSDSDSSSSSDSGPYEYVNADTLTVGTNLPAPGFWDAESPDDVTGGLEYDMAVEAAKRLGLANGVKVVNVLFDTLVAGQAKGFDVALSQVTITKDRAKVVDFSVPYFDGDQGVMVAKSNPIPITTDAQAKAVQWGIQTGTTADDVMAKLKPTKEPRQYPETTQMFAALQARQIDAAMIDTTILLAQSSQDGGQTFEVVGQFKTGEHYGGVMPKGSKFKKKFDTVLQAMIDDGTVERLAAEDLVPTFPVNPNDVPVIPLP
jgi:polar amino acid transport system substrate-binding protein